MNILLAEDDAAMRKILTLYLKKEGYTVTAVADGEAALAVAADGTMDLLLLDWMLPKKKRRRGVPGGAGDGATGENHHADGAYHRRR